MESEQLSLFSSDGIKEAIEKLRKEMAKEAMCKAKCFTIDSVITRWYNLFEEVL